MNFANNLISIRSARNITRKQLADALGVTTAAIGLWETGRREPSLTTLVAIADFFMISPDDLLADIIPDVEEIWFLSSQKFLKKTSFRVVDLNDSECILYFIGTPLANVLPSDNMPHQKIKKSILKTLYEHRFQVIAQFFSDSLYRTFVCSLSKTNQ